MLFKVKIYGKEWKLFQKYFYKEFPLFVKEIFFLFLFPESFLFGLKFRISQERELMLNNTMDQSHSLSGLSVLVILWKCLYFKYNLFLSCFKCQQLHIKLNTSEFSFQKSFLTYKEYGNHSTENVIKFAVSVRS